MIEIIAGDIISSIRRKKEKKEDHVCSAIKSDATVISVVRIEIYG
jgi:hypothetical protein